jgi:glucosamine-6-phosphate deaminase
VEGGVSHCCPLSCLQNHPRATIICDEAAAGELKAGTIDYFNSLEQSAREWASRELADRNQIRRPAARAQTSPGQDAGENRP